VPEPRHNLAIDTTTRQGSITLGRGDTVLQSVDLPAQRRHHVGLMPGIDQLCREHNVTPADLAECYLTLGPGSFTGLRVAVAAAKMLALAHPLKLVAVPTLDAVAHNAPPEHTHIAVGLNLKRGTMYTAAYQRTDDTLTQTRAPELRTIDELLQHTPRPLALVGEVLPELPDDHAQNDITVLPPEYARPTSATVWALGRALAARHEYADPLTLEPHYVRRPEAVELWDQRAKSNV